MKKVVFSALLLLATFIFAMRLEAQPACPSGFVVTPSPGGIFTFSNPTCYTTVTEADGWCGYYYDVCCNDITGVPKVTLREIQQIGQGCNVNIDNPGCVPLCE